MLKGRDGDKVIMRGFGFTLDAVMLIYFYSVERIEYCRCIRIAIDFIHLQ
jgi:hypothetical protein